MRFGRIVMSSFMTFNLRSLAHIFIYFLFVFIFCEFIIYYVVILQCTWPQLEPEIPEGRPLKIVLIADIHLLGPKRGHWFDKLRREWQMYRSFQTMMMVHSPSNIFFLGDTFDEGLWSNDKEFNDYVERFKSLFSVSKNTDVYVVAGNHDIGFHYSITPYLSQRFVKALHAPVVQLLTIKDNVFVLINSMAMEGDGCSLCLPAVNRLKRISLAINCSKYKISSDCDGLPKLPPNVRPILLQHFPMYRESDAECEGPDTVPEAQKNELFREKWECLSKSASEQVINPRVIFGGHTHHGCLVIHPPNIPEWSVPSFSWRNLNNPSFLLVSVTPQKYSVRKCFLPQESTVIFTYQISVVMFIMWFIITKICSFRLWPNYNKRL